MLSDDAQTYVLADAATRGSKRSSGLLVQPYGGSSGYGIWQSHGDIDASVTGLEAAASPSFARVSDAGRIERIAFDAASPTDDLVGLVEASGLLHASFGMTLATATAPAGRGALYVQNDGTAHVLAPVVGDAIVWLKDSGDATNPPISAIHPGSLKLVGTDPTGAAKAYDVSSTSDVSPAADGTTLAVQKISGAPSGSGALLLIDALNVIDAENSTNGKTRQTTGTITGTGAIATVVSLGVTNGPLAKKLSIQITVASADGTKLQLIEAVRKVKWDGVAADTPTIATSGTDYTDDADAIGATLTVDANKPSSTWYARVRVNAPIGYRVVAVTSEIW